MSFVAGTRTRHLDPLGVIAFISGALGLALSAGLWLVHVHPSSEIFGSYGFELAYGGLLRDQMIWLTGTFGVVALVAALLARIGARPGSEATAGLIMGVLALTYPVLASLHVVVPPLAAGVFA